MLPQYYSGCGARPQHVGSTPARPAVASMGIRRAERSATRSSRGTRSGTGPSRIGSLRARQFRDAYRQAFDPASRRSSAPGPDLVSTHGPHGRHAEIQHAGQAHRLDRDLPRRMIRDHLRDTPNCAVDRSDYLRARTTALAGSLPSWPDIHTLVSTNESRSTPCAMPSPSSIQTRSSVARLPVALLA